MPRPPRCRRICGAPQVDTFCPNGCENTKPILLTLDEYEVIRLVDLEQQTHEQCAAQMDISLPHLRRAGGSPLRPLVPDAESQHRKIQQKMQRRFHYENCSYL